MKQLYNFIQEKLKINSKSKINEIYEVGDIIENYNLGGNKYNLICCIREGDLEDKKPRFIIDDDIMKYAFCGDISIDCKDETDINGYENTNDIIHKYLTFCSQHTICGAREIRKKYSYDTYLPAIGELYRLNENIDLIDKKLKKSIKGLSFYSSTQYSDDKVYSLTIGNDKIYKSYTMYTGNILPFVML